MRVLAIDSSMNGCSACVYESKKTEVEGDVIAQNMLKSTKGHAEHLMPLIERTLKVSEISYHELDIIGVTNGPGAFTGMRIALATARAIALAADKPVIGVSTILAVLDSYLSKQEPTEKSSPYYAVILETKRKDYYFQMFDVCPEKEATAIKGIAESCPAIIANAFEISSIISKKDVLLVGDATNRLMSECNTTWPSIEIMKPSGKSVAELAAINYQKNAKEEGGAPVYLRNPEIGKAKTIYREIKS